MKKVQIEAPLNDTMLKEITIIDVPTLRWYWHMIGWLAVLLTVHGLSAHHQAAQMKILSDSCWFQHAHWHSSF